MTRSRKSRSTDFDPTDIFASLNRARIRYLVVGGIAAVLYGVNRFTWDVDLAVELTTDNLERLDRALEGMGFMRRVPVPITGLADSKTRMEWLKQKGMKVYSFVERKSPPRVIDVMVRPPGRFPDVYRRRHVVRSRGIAIPLVPVDVLVRMKREAGRPEDLLDIAYLTQLGLVK